MADKMKLLILLLVPIMTISCLSVSKPVNDGNDSEVGWLHGNCLAIKNSNIPSQHQFTLVHLDNGNTTEKAVIIKKATEGEECYPLFDDRSDVNKSAGYFFYLVKSEKPVDLAIGVMRPKDVSGLDFTFCNTTEGIQFFLSKRKSVIWKGYYYLGYESEPTCTQK